MNARIPLVVLLWCLCGSAQAQELLPYLSSPRVQPNSAMPGQELFLVLSSNGCGVFEREVVPQVTRSGNVVTAVLSVVEPCALRPLSFDMRFSIGTFPVGNYTLIYQPRGSSALQTLPQQTSTFSVRAPPPSWIRVTPTHPTTADVISVTELFSAGPYVLTKSHAISGNLVHIRFVQDGGDFSPNPPHFATESIGLLAAGEYTFTVDTENPGLATATSVFTVTVQAFPSIPAVGTFGLAALVVMLVLLGLGSRMHSVRRA